MKCLMAAMASFLLCPNSANAQSPSADKVVPLRAFGNNERKSL